MSLTGRSTCVSASALSLDAQPAQADSVVSRTSRPVCGIGIKPRLILAKVVILQVLLSRQTFARPDKTTSNQSLWLLVAGVGDSRFCDTCTYTPEVERRAQMTVTCSINQGVVGGAVVVVAGV
jgi:hypothetical protein